MTEPPAMPPDSDTLPQRLRPHLRPLDGNGLLDFIGDARIVLLGEASHGTHEFYAMRAALTQRLVAERGFNAVVVEADWPDAWRVNRYVRGLSGDRSADEALAGFRRFPTWMWSNTVVRDFARSLRRHNLGVAPERQAGFYGMDLYSLFGSIEAVLRYLEATDPEEARRARERYACFDHFGRDSQAYGYVAGQGLRPGCEDQVAQQLRELMEHAAQRSGAPGHARDEAFHAEQNARLVRNAEEYYRAMYRGRASSWNLRDQHMLETLQALERHLADGGRPLPKMVVWAHNSHLGDASATEMARQGEWNVGQLAREHWDGQALLVGFSTYRGSVTAATDWDAPARRRRVRDGLPGSFEDLFHRTGEPAFWLGLRGNESLGELLAQPRLQRAIGVIYRPETERWSHYFETQLPAQFDALVHIDETRAVEPLEPDAGWSPGGQSEKAGEPAETYPSGV
ncbi:erythromycin esterase family protein [Ramlibacter tataouinensis]|uniref:Erythromycin esterase n=1 Tax=Ramlibacter tataouinensis (strain ATCC BAA-407 / DSM 14655 / LMG 21543 / TTB310) TaxID=365046 RepID=F5XYG3_RAMTT|nr:erythromycin esterase family protein [Ramlibacter tataouinensis]AEG93139.1 conserved hypothetical protein [Ramlibacter tataouinensis TTB310]